MNHLLKKMSTYRRVVIDTLGDLSTVRADEKSFPALQDNEILVKMEFTTLNPSDYYTTMGGYPSNTFPTIIGLEGSGTVTQAGSDAYAQSLLHKRVAVRGPGTWSEYITSSADEVFPLLDSTTFEQAANLIVNPMTVALFMEIIKAGNHKAIIQNAAASALGKMLIRWGKLEGIHVVNLVRRQEQVDVLSALGTDLILNTSEENWKAKASELLKSVGGATIGFDAIAGSGTNELMELLENGSTLYTYGRLSGEDCKTAPRQIMMLGKTLKGLWLMPWLASKTREQRVEVGNLVQSLLGPVFHTDHSKTIHLGTVKDALINYKNESATNNKILVRTAFD